MGIVYKLIIEDDEGKTTVVPLSRPEISIGRMEGNTIRLMERNVSRRHARLVRHNGNVLIEDLNSFNGVKLNGERIDQRIEIKEGDLVEIGDYHLALQSQEIQEPAPAPAPPPAAAPGALMAPAAPATQESVLPPFPASGVTSPLGLSAPALPEPGKGAQAQRTEQLAVGPLPVTDFPRLICVTTEYAGREYSLSRPETIIGRVDENDVVIEHRSVSRNHAKIVFDGRVHKVIDLESANGILVNGEEYAITDLRRGDLIELGHVCFRYIPPGEPFVPTEEEVRNMLAAGVTPPPSRSVAAPTSAPSADGQKTVKNAIDLPLEPDPSNAQTVTDTPLSVLAPEPSVRPAAPAPAPRRASEGPHVDDAPTEAADVFPSAEPPRARPSLAESSESEVTLRSGGSSRWMAVIAAIAVVLVAVIGYRFLRASDRLDTELQSLFDAGRYGDVETFYLEHRNDFSDSTKAYRLASEATMRLRDTKKPEPAPAPEPEGRREDPAPAPEPTEEPPTEVAGTAEPAPRAVAPAPSEERKAAAPSVGKKRTDRAKKLEQSARRALITGDQKGAVALFEECISLADLPDCHRGLGTAFRQTDEITRSCFHYERYLQLSPNAPEAERVRETFKQQCR